MCLQSWDGEHDWEEVGDAPHPDFPDDEDAPHRRVAVRAVRSDDAHRGVGGAAGVKVRAYLR